MIVSISCIYLFREISLSELNIVMGDINKKTRKEDIISGIAKVSKMLILFNLIIMCNHKAPQ